MIATKSEKSSLKWLVIFSLVFAGEMIFGLPFHVARFFRPTLMEVFHLSHTDLGDIIAVYGIAAMLAYFPGGVIADRFSDRKLMTIALVATGIGGFYMLKIPGQVGLSLLFGYWGISTILLFWAAMLRATRLWGGNSKQGEAFGILDGGRGLVAALVAWLAVWIFAEILSGNSDNASILEQTKSLQAVILLYIGMTFLAAGFIWFLIPESKNTESDSFANSFKGIKQVFSNRAVWLQAAIVITAYCGYRSLDYYSLYAVEVLGMDDLSASKFVSNAAFLRPVGAVTAGLLADRISASKVIGWLYAVLIIAFILLALINPTSFGEQVIYVNLLFTFFAVYGLRGTYFALLNETQIKINMTGTAVGVISVIGYTPDIFFASMAGRILDANPGILGYHNLYLLMALFASIGVIAVLGLRRLKVNI